MSSTTDRHDRSAPTNRSQSGGLPSLSLLGILSILIAVKGTAMLKAMDDGLDWLKQCWLRLFIALNGYKFAAAILATMAIGARIDPTNGIFRAITQAVPVLTPVAWEVVFWICTWRMWTLKSGGRWEAPSVIVCFLFPVISFYMFLFLLAFRSPSVTPFTDILILLAIVTPVAFVTRTAAFNFYRDQMPLVVAENQRLKREIEQRDQLSVLTEDEEKP